MPQSDKPTPRRRRSARPLDPARMNDLALSYVARFSTTAARLASYLKRKLRERGWDGEAEPDVDALVTRFVAKGYVDDAGFARMRADSLLRRGYGARRVGEALHHAGVSEEDRQAVAPGERSARKAAAMLARRRRFGPWFAGALEHERREKQFAAMLRAGHDFGHARFVVDASGEAAIDAWIDEVSDEE